MKVVLKKATVEAFLTAAKERSEFINRHRGKTVLECTLDNGTFPMEYDELCQKEVEKALDLYADSGEKIAHFTFISLASACFDVLGLDVEETFAKMLQLLGIEVTE